jgi:hypothetical protein
MDAIAIFFTAMVLGTIVLAPFFGAESRPDFIRPDRKARRFTFGSMKPSDWQG